MKRLLVVLAFAGLLAGCHRSHEQGQGSYQGTTGSQGGTSTNEISGPQGMGTDTNSFNSKDTNSSGATGSQTQPGTSGTGSSDMNTNPDKSQDNSGDQTPDDTGTSPQ